MDEKIEQERYDAQRELIQLIVDEWATTGNLRAAVARQAAAYQVEPYTQQPSDDTGRNASL
jgi:hypothetical protein